MKCTLRISQCIFLDFRQRRCMMLDFYSDPYTELISFIAAGIDGVITDNLKTASAFMIEPADLPPASTHIPPLQVTDVIDPPLPPVNARARKDSDKGGGGSSESSQRRVNVDAYATTLTLIGLVYVLLW
ncbi:hypothetical protein Tco_0642434 [Tanacetum coccineum]